MPFVDPPWNVTVDDGTAARCDLPANTLPGPVYVGDDPGPGTLSYRFFAFFFPPRPVPEFVGDPRDRLRSTVSEDLGSLLDAVEAIPVDLGFDVAFTNAVHQEPAQLMAYRELTRATDSPTVDLAVYPRPQQNTVMEEQFSGVTVLSRLATWYPPRWYGTVTELGIPNTDGAATAQAVITALLTGWANMQPWLSFKPVPDLRMPTGAAPSEYGPTDGLVTTETVTIRQDEEHRATALDILRDLLSPFPGTIARQDSEGDLVIIPLHGPDADETPQVTIRDFDAYSVSTGKPDPFSTWNRAIFTAVGGLTRSDDVPVMQPAWFQVGSNYQLGRDTWFEPPNDRVNLQPNIRAGHTAYQQSLSMGQFNQQRPNIWPVAEDAIAAGAGIGLFIDNVNNPTITAAWRRYSGTNLEDSGTATVDLITYVIPFDGTWRDAWRVTIPITFGPDIRLTIRARWNEQAGGIELAFGENNQMESGCFDGCEGWVIEFTLNDNSVAYAELGETTGQFGFVGDSLPTEAGGDAVMESQAAYGVREKRVTIRGYALDASLLTEAARGFVLHNITPRVTREVELSLGAQGVTFDTIGRLVELPSGERGVLNGLTYSDEFTNGAWSKVARVQLRDMTAAGAIPTNPFQNAITDTAGVVLTDTSGNPITVTIGDE